MKDALQKAKLYRHFTARGWYALPEIPVFYKGRFLDPRRLITDVDMLALRPSQTLEWELVLGDCKTLKEHSPANRAVWLRGLMAHFSSRSGIIILKRRPIDQDHKLFASSFGVTLLDEQEFEHYDRALIYPEGSSAIESTLTEHQLVRSLHEKYPRLQPFIDYLFALAWNEGELLSLIRRVIGESRNVAKEIDPRNSSHLGLVLEATGVFAVGLARCVGIIFNQFRQLQSQAKLDDGLRILIWGGREQYNFFAKLRTEMVLSKGKESDAGLTLPEWDRFIELVREMLECPSLCFELPQLLREASACVIKESSFLPSVSASRLLLLKYGMLTVKYVCRSANFPPDTERTLIRLFVQKQSQLVHLKDSDISSSRVTKDHIRVNKEQELKADVKPAVEALPGEVTMKNDSSITTTDNAAIPASESEKKQIDLPVEFVVE